MSKEESKQNKALSPTAVLIWASGAVVVVIIADIVKARQFATFTIEHAEKFYTLSWLLDGLVAGIVTFALAYVALSLRRMERNLERYEEESEGILRRLKDTQNHLDKLKYDILNVSKGLAAKGGILQKLDSPILHQALTVESALNSSFIDGLNQLTGAWVTLIEKEFNRSVTGETNYGLICWRTTIATYLAEEASDIEKSTVATNIGVYLKLIKTLVEEILTKIDGTSSTAELFAATALLPSEYFNWREYGSKAGEPKVLSVSPPFMDEYRDAIKSWLKKANLTLTRVILVNALRTKEVEDHARIANLSLQELSDLETQARYGILCGFESNQPEKLDLNKIEQYEAVVVPSWLKNKDRAKAYAIARDFRKKAEELKTERLTERKLFQVFEEEFHSRPKDLTDSHARYLAIRSEEDLRILDCLPKIPNSTERSTEAETEPRKEPGTQTPTPDFLVIQLKKGDGKPKAIACIAALLKPNFETMALKLITDPKDLDPLDKFIDYCCLSKHAGAIKDI
jgi:hypothetical protein